VIDKFTQRSRGFGFIEMKTILQGERHQQLNAPISWANLVVNEAVPD